MAKLRGGEPAPLRLASPATSLYYWQMAEYKIPLDPHRDDANDNKQNNRDKEPVPWAWLGGGVLVALVGLLIGWLVINAFLLRPPLDVLAVSPTIVVLTAPPSLVPTETPILPTATFIPTLTPIPTPDAAVVPLEIMIGFYAKVANTDGIGVTVRGGPSVNNASIVIAAEGDVVLIIDGPAEGNDLLWWQLQLDDGTEGWAAGDYLVPAAMP